MARKKRYVMFRSGPHVVVRSHADDAYAITGWAGDYGSTRDPGAMELYGSWRAGGEWEWKLSEGGVRSLKNGLQEGLAEPKRFDLSRSESSRYKELLEGLGACRHCRDLKENHVNQMKCLFHPTNYTPSPRAVC
jgi:hypothetical protein